MSTTISKEMKLDGLALDAALDGADDAYFAEGEENLAFKKAVLAAIRVYVDEASKPVAEAVKVKPEPIGYVTGSNLRAMKDGLQGIMTVSNVENALFSNPIYAIPPAIQALTV